MGGKVQGIPMEEHHPRGNRRGEGRGIAAASAHSRRNWVRAAANPLSRSCLLFHVPCLLFPYQPSEPTQKLSEVDLDRLQSPALSDLQHYLPLSQLFLVEL